MPRQDSARRRLPELDALRGLAALAVVLFHFTYFVAEMFPGTPRSAVEVVYGWYGVQLFFAISGFVILMTIERVAGARAFVVARFWRLVPTYWLAMAITFASMWLFGPERLRADAVDVVANLTMLQWYLQSFIDLRMVDGAYWSLNVEVVFYAAMLGLWRLRLLERIELVMMGWMALKWTAAFLPPALDRLLLLDQIAFFAIGIASYRIWSGRRSLVQQAPVFAFAVMTVVVTNDADRIVLITGLVLVFAAVATGRLAWLDAAPLRWLGDISYPLYLLHSYIGYAVILRLAGAGVPVEMAAACAMAIVLALSAAVTYAFEHPLRRAVRRGRGAGGRLTAALSPSN